MWSLDEKQFEGAGGDAEWRYLGRQIISDEPTFRYRGRLR
jgi:hypothetical protein